MKMKALALVGVAGFCVSSAQAAVTLDSATAFTRATAAIVTAKHFDPKEKDKQAVLKPGKHAVNASVSVSNNDAKGDRGYDSEDVYANIKNPSSGTIDFSGNSTSLSNSGNKIVEAYNSGSSFNYDFTITTNYIFSISYALSETDFGGFDNYLQLISTAGGPPIFSASPLNGSYTDPAFGTLSAMLTPGSYEFGVTSRLGDFSGVEGLGFSAGAHAEQYAFNIAAVPEPVTWAMMIGGFGLIGGMMRRAHRKSEDDFTRNVWSLAVA